MKLRLLATVVAVCSLYAVALGKQNSTADAPKALSLSAYSSKISRLTQSLEDLKKHPGNAAILRDQLPPAWPVMMGSQRVDVPTGWLRSGLDGIEKNPKDVPKEAGQLIAHLKSMKQEILSMDASPAQGDAAAREKLKGILAMSEFSDVHGPTRFDLLLQGFRRWLAEWLHRLSLKAAGHQGIASLIFWLVLILGGSGLLAWMLQRLLRRPDAQDIQFRPPGSELMHSWEQMAEESRKAAAAGEYREAIRLSYWAAIRKLDDAGMWPVDHTRTHREYLSLVRRDQPQREPLAELTRKFEMAWYAARPSSENDFESVITQLEKLECA